MSNLSHQLMMISTTRPVSKCAFFRGLILLTCLLGHVSSRVCFPWNGNTALKNAVNDYIKNGGAKSAAGRKYGLVIGNWCVSRVASFAGVFLGQKTFNERLTGWDTSNATSFARMFEGASIFNQPLGHFNTAKVTTMDRVFYGALMFQGIGLDKWNTGRVTSLYWAFRNSAMNADIRSWNVRSVNDLRETFRFTPYNRNLCRWGETLRRVNLPSARLVNMFDSTRCPIRTSPSFSSSPAGPFCQACLSWRWGKTCFADGEELYNAAGDYAYVVSALPSLSQRMSHPLSVKYGYPISRWCTKNVESFDYIFAGLGDFNEPLTFWNTSSAVITEGMFSDCTSFNQNLSHFDMSKVTNAKNMFQNTNQFRGFGLENWNVGRIHYFRFMFNNAWAFNADISRWDVSAGLDFGHMFDGAAAFRQDLSSWRPVLAVNMEYMFQFASMYDQNLCAWGSQIVVSATVTDMFKGTRCPVEYLTPSLADNPLGPLCGYCSAQNTTAAFPTVHNLVEGPYPLPLVPAAVTQLRNNVILAWAGDEMLTFDNGDRPAGTFTCKFNLDTKNSSLLRVQNGRVLITGGLSDFKATIYDPFNDTWTATTNMNVQRGYHSQLTLANGMAFVFGGSWSSVVGGKIGEVYNPVTRTWTPKRGIGANGSVVTNDVVGFYRSDNHMWLFEATNGKIIHVGPARMMHWLDLTGNGSVTEAGLRGDDLDAMSGGVAMIDIDTIFTVGGAENYEFGPASKRAYVIDISGNQSVVTRQPDMRWPRAFVNVVVLPNGCVVVSGGQMQVVLFSDEYGVPNLEMYCPSTQTWSVLAQPLTFPRTYHSVAILLQDGRILIGGGGLAGAYDDYAPWNHPNVEIVTPPYLLDSTGSPLSARPSIIEGSSTFVPGGQIVVTMNTADPHTFAIMRLGSTTHTVNLDQRRVPLTVSSQVGAEFTLQVPTNPVHAPVGLYWLFALDSNGVPSIGWDLTGLPS